MDETPNLRLPYIMAAQAQKHVTHNEAIRALDAIVHLSARDRDLTTPPPSPGDGDRYIVAAPATGGWAGHENEIAAYQDGAWMFYAPREGWIAWLADEDAAVVWDGAAWISFVGSESGGSSSNPAMLGINATPDATNRLAVASPASLFNHEGNGHQIKINKNAAGDTASTLYQTNWSGRAEMGLTGDDDFHFKVSPDGVMWNEAIVINRTTGAVSFPNTSLAGGRELLTAARTYYVNGLTGSDANNGLAPGTAFATIQKAVNTVASLDLSIYDATISIAAGTYAEEVFLKPLIGAGRCYLVGDEVTPANVLISPPSGDAFYGESLFSTYHLRGMKIVSSGASAIYVSNPGVVFFRNIDFGACGFAHVRSQSGGAIYNDGDYKISGGAGYHAHGVLGAIYLRLATVTLTGTPAFTMFGASAFAYADRLSIIQVTNVAFTGSATGKRYSSTNNSVIFTGAGVNYLPGNAAGTTATGGQYA